MLWFSLNKIHIIISVYINFILIYPLKSFLCSSWAELILQPFRHFTYVTAHSPSFPLLYLSHSSFSNPSITSPTLQFMSRAHSPTFSSLHVHHNSFSNTSVALPTSQLILQPFRYFTYVTVHDQSSFSNLFVTPPTSNSFSNTSVTLPTSQLILQPFRHFTYVTTHTPTLPSLYPRHSSFSNPSFDSPTSQALHLIHLASRPCS